MAKLVILSVLLIFAAANSGAGGVPAEVTATIAPLRGSYHLGEPLAVRLVLKNTSGKKVGMELMYPNVVGSFECDGATEPPRPVTLNGLVDYRSIAPGEEFRYVVALNRYLTFPKNGRYVVEFTAVYEVGRAPPRKGQGTYASTNHTSTATFNITIEPGKIDEKWIKAIAAVLDGKDKQASMGKDKISKDEAVELLCWADTPLVVEPLIAAGRDPRLPNASAYAVEAIQRRFKKDEQARKAILEIASHSGMGAFQEALGAFEKEGVVIPSQWFKSTLSSRSTGCIYLSLEYLQKHGKREDVDLVEPLTNDANPEIAHLAAAMVKDLKARPPAKPPAAPGKEKK